VVAPPSVNGAQAWKPETGCVHGFMSYFTKKD
jgi:hypothetical protein